MSGLRPAAALAAMALVTVPVCRLPAQVEGQAPVVGALREQAVVAGRAAAEGTRDPAAAVPRSLAFFQCGTRPRRLLNAAGGVAAGALTGLLYYSVLVRPWSGPTPDAKRIKGKMVLGGAILGGVGLALINPSPPPCRLVAGAPGAA